MALVELTPTAHRPYIDGSTDNSFLNLTFGYNGLGRIFGNSTGGGAGAGGGGRSSFGHSVGLSRMFDGDLGGHISWLIPAAVMLGLVGLWVVGRGSRTGLRRAALLLWGTTMVVTALTFSLMEGIFHQYYTLALAPAIGALVGIGTWLVWTRRNERWALPVLAAVSVVTTAWAFIVLARSPEWNPWLRWTLLVVGLAAATGLLLGRRFGTTMLRASVGLALVAALAGPTAWTIQTVVTPHSGGAVTTGPIVEGSESRAPAGLDGPAGVADGADAAGARPSGAAAGGRSRVDSCPVDRPRVANCPVDKRAPAPRP